jgi:hypothetical protein
MAQAMSMTPISQSRDLKCRTLASSAAPSGADAHRTKCRQCRAGARVCSMDLGRLPLCSKLLEGNFRSDSSRRALGRTQPAGLHARGGRRGTRAGCQLAHSSSSPGRCGARSSAVAARVRLPPERCPYGRPNWPTAWPGVEPSAAPAARWVIVCVRGGRALPESHDVASSPNLDARRRAR